MKFKVGDKVKTYFGYEGEIVFIEKSKDIPYVVKMKGFNGHDGEGWGYRYVNEDGLKDKWWFLEDQLELLENKEIVEIDLKADKMFEELGIKRKLIHDDKVLHLHDEHGYFDAYLDLEIKEFAIDINRYAENTVLMHKAIHEKMKELGWLE